MTQTYSTYLEIATDAARAAGQLLREGWNTPHQIEFKGEINLVTEVDRASEALILERLRAATPEFNILTEEAGAYGNGATFRWVIDPVDGTTNYAHHFPYFSVSIALEENGASVAGVVYDPIHEQLFTATRGGGGLVERGADSVWFCHTDWTESDCDGLAVRDVGVGPGDSGNCADD